MPYSRCRHKTNLITGVQNSTGKLYIFPVQEVTIIEQSAKFKDLTPNEKATTGCECHITGGVEAAFVLRSDASMDSSGEHWIVGSASIPECARKVLIKDLGDENSCLRILLSRSK
jgi:hypothetical protein